MRFFNDIIDIDAFTQIHDCYFDIYNISLRLVEINRLYYQAPQEIKELAKKWGWFETEVREKIYEWLSCNNNKKF